MSLGSRTDTRYRQDGRYPSHISSGQTPVVVQRLSSNVTSSREAFLITSPPQPGRSALPSHQAACTSPQSPITLPHCCVLRSLSNSELDRARLRHPQYPVQSQPQSSSPGNRWPVSSCPVGFPYHFELQPQQVTVSKLFFFSRKTHQMKAGKEAQNLGQSHLAEALKAPGLLGELWGPGIRQTWNGIPALPLPGHTTRLRLPI